MGANQAPGGGHNGFGRRSIFYFSRFSAPLPRRGRISPRPPSRREGGESRLFHARGFAPCIPATEPARHWEMGANQAPGRGHGGFACRIALPLWEPGGGHNGFGRRSIFYFSRFPAPIPPDPLPGGKGETKVFFMQGASPLASPRLRRRRHGLNLRCRCPLGGLPSLPPAMLFCPHPPNPLPGGKGEIFTLFRRGLPPPAPLH